MRSVIPTHIVYRGMWLTLGFFGVIATAIFLTNLVDAHDDDGTNNGVTRVEPDTSTVLRKIWEATYSPCGELLTITESGQESGDLRELGMFASVSGLPSIQSSRFQRCISNSLTGETAASFLINDRLVLVISNSELERSSLISQLRAEGDLASTSESTELRNDAMPSSKIRTSVFRTNPTDKAKIVGSSSFSINNFLRKKEQ